jgi:hypothetical protein
MQFNGVTCVFNRDTWAALSLSIVVGIGCAGLPFSAYSQDAAAPVSAGGVVAGAPVIPQQVRYAGTLANRSGDTVEAVFSIYAAQEGGEPLWTETQPVTVDMNGSYTVLLGSATAAGLPQSLFAGGAARWVGVSVERAPELTRVLLSSVPYAMKSADAQSLAGHPAGDFVTQEQLSQLATQRDAAPSPAITPLTGGTVTGSGIAGTIPMWTGTLTQGNSEMVQVGSRIGINEPTPAATLDVNGTGMVRGTLSLPALGTATTSIGYGSQVSQWNASVWSTTAGGAVAPTFKLHMNPIGNNTATPSGNLAFTYQLGTSSSTVLSVTGNGLLTSFGGVTTSTPTPATSSGAVNSPLLEVGASVYSSHASSAVPQNFAWQAVGTGNDTTTPSANLSLLYGSGAPPVATGLSISSKGLINWAAGQTFPGTGAGTITGITTSSPLTGSGTSGSVALGLDQSALTTNIIPGLETTFDGRYAEISGGDVFQSYIEALSTNGPGYAAIIGSGSFGSSGIYGGSDSGIGVQGESFTGQGVYGDVDLPIAGSSGVVGLTGLSFSGTYSILASTFDAGVWADTSGTGSGEPAALVATGDNVYGEAIFTNGASFPSLFVENFTGGASEFAATTGYGVQAISASGTGIQAVTEGGGDGLVGLNLATTEEEAGVLGVANGQSLTYGDFAVSGGVWGDTGTSSTDAPAWAIGVLGTADDSFAGVFINNSIPWPTIFVENNSSGGVTGLFNTLMASGPGGTCGIGGGGSSLTCTGPIKSLASAGNGARTVETYGMQSPENWMEDFGAGELQKGVAMVSLDPTFAETVSESADYHVFLTPRGDSKGLYVTNVTPGSFEVRESGGGTSTLSFDYRIVAKRRGYEAMRHVDVTDHYNAEMKSATMVRRKGALRTPTALAKSPLQMARGMHPRRIPAARTPVSHRPGNLPANRTPHP